MPDDEPIGNLSAGQLRAIIERVERLEEEKREVADQIKEVYAEAKGNGFDVKAIRKIVSMRRMSADERAEQQAILDLYMNALGMLADTPLGQAAVARQLVRDGLSKVEIREGGLRTAMADRVEAAFAGMPGVTVTRGA